ncbi:unnamed protein product, partial [Mycena citricolor]
SCLTLALAMCRLRVSTLCASTILLFSPLVQAQSDASHIPTSTVAICLVVVALILLIVSCSLQRHRAIRRQQTISTVPPALVCDNGFPHGLQFGSNVYRSLNGPLPQRNGATEYPPLNTTELAPPPYVKEGGEGCAPVYQPPPGPMPGSDGSFNPPLGPPPPAHVATHPRVSSAGFAAAPGTTSPPIGSPPAFDLLTRRDPGPTS